MGRRFVSRHAESTSHLRRFPHLAREDRQYALDHLGLPVDFRPSRATTIRIAQTLDADFVIVGSYNVTNGRIAVQAQVLEVRNLKLSAPLQDSSELNRLFDVENAIAWKIGAPDRSTLQRGPADLSRRFGRSSTERL